MDLIEYKKRYSADDAAPGWDAIDRALGNLYPGQEPKHYGTTALYLVSIHTTCFSLLIILMFGRTTAMPQWKLIWI
ncbi:hypothetical protein VVS316_03138 [Vibrio vulnificus]|nr:hypothetical protein VVS316_03138 [Vibrio vulnificus]